MSSFFNRLDIKKNKSILSKRLMSVVCGYQSCSIKICPLYIVVKLVVLCYSSKCEPCDPLSF